MNEKLGEDEDALLIEEIQSLLQEKRTALKVIRIGIAVFVAQVGAAGYLLSAFGRHALAKEGYSMGVLAALGVIIVGVSVYLVFGSVFRIQGMDRKILKLKQRHSAMAAFKIL